MTYSIMDENYQRGVQVSNSGANFTLRDSNVTNNGGVESPDGTGGVVVAVGSANLGDGSSPGHNCIYGNREVIGGDDDAMEVNNKTASTVNARYNYWGNGTNGPAGTNGSVNADNVWTGPCSP